MSQMASMEAVGAQDVELKFVAAGEWLVSSLMNNLNWSKLEKDPRFALSGHGLPLYWLSRGQSSDWFVFWHLLWYLEKLSLEVRSSTTVLSARTPTSLLLMRPFVLTLLLLAADQHCIRAKLQVFTILHDVSFWISDWKRSHETSFVICGRQYHQLFEISVLRPAVSSADSPASTVLVNFSSQ